MLKLFFFPFWYIDNNIVEMSLILSALRTLHDYSRVEQENRRWSLCVQRSIVRRVSIQPDIASRIFINNSRIFKYIQSL